MTFKNLIVNNNIQSSHINKKFSKKLFKNFKNIFSEIKQDIKNEKRTLNILDEKFKLNFKFKDLNRFKKFKKISIIGMGGSILGVEALHSFIKEKIKKKIYFFNDLNIQKITKFKKRNNKDILFIIISKSGNTIETLSNIFALNIFKKNAKNIIIISEKKNNFLFLLSKKLNLFYIEHKDHVGGRFSVLSETGIVPAYLMGVNISKLRSKIFTFFNSQKKVFLKDSSIKLANLIQSKKIKTLVFLNYSPKLEKLLFWCQQMIAESLGKNNKGFFPVVSNVPKDHHSLLQLYLDGPKDKIFHIFSLEEKTQVKIKTEKLFNSKNFINNKKLTTIKLAQKNAVIKALKIKNIPFREFKIRKSSEEVLGEIFSYFILETVAIGKLLRINPFDQPAVEQVKTFTKRFLS